ncbi:unnamed protein product [Colias eurytheme]|nr:unnamed protein product [Colias eurytheme]
MYENPMDKIELDLISKRCQNLAKELHNSYILKVEAEITKNPKIFWTHIKTKRGGSSAYPSTMTDGDTTSSNGSTICNLFASYFSSVYTPKGEDTSINDFNSLSVINTGGQCLTCPTLHKDCVLKILKSLNVNKGAGPDGIPPLFISATASALAAPLVMIYNKSLISGSFPQEWKKAKVVPVHKSDKKNVISNYRPISILSSFAKVFESLICPFIQRHFRQFLSDQQHGFIQSRSTTTNLLTFTESLVQCVDENKQFDVIYTDFSKAFDKISHPILLQKLSAYGVTGSLLHWLQSYITGREFFVVVNGFTSNVHHITSGAPQGSHLAPILFNIYVNDLPHCFSFSEVFLYADDLKFAKKIDKPSDTCLLQEDLNRLIQWCALNDMQLNPKKCYHMKFSRKNSAVHSKYYIGNQAARQDERSQCVGGRAGRAFLERAVGWRIGAGRGVREGAGAPGRRSARRPAAHVPGPASVAREPLPTKQPLQPARATSPATGGARRRRPSPALSARLARQNLSTRF